MKVNEIFYSLQGEGRWTGTPAVFLRLSGCNMKCWFCDTKHEAGTEMTEEEIAKEARRYPARHIVITGGEPTLQLTSRLTDLLHEEGFFIQIETNGSIALSEGTEVDWITCSPKGNEIKLQRIDELKLLFISEYIEKYKDVGAKEYRLQPVDNANGTRRDEPQANNVNSLQDTIIYIKEHPKWHLSLQTHKIINIQ